MYICIYMCVCVCVCVCVCIYIYIYKKHLVMHRTVRSLEPSCFNLLLFLLDKTVQEKTMWFGKIFFPDLLIM